MKVLLVNGSPHKSGCTYTALAEISSQLEKNGIESEIYHIGTTAISGCIACGTCHKTGKCSIDDSVNALAARLDEFDGFVFGSPVYYAAPNGALISFMDRLFYSAGSKMHNKPGCAVVSCRRGGASAAFDCLNKYFTISNMPVVPSQYWNQVHGSCPEDVKKDLEGMQTMRTLADNLAWLIKCTKGVKTPEREAKVRTNFIQ